MSRGVYIALSGALAQAQTVETTAANLANTSTNGYQKLRPVFHEMLVGQEREGAFTSTRQMAIDSAPGAVRTTGRPLDVAFPQDAYLAVTTPRGERYTRDGALQLATDGTLKTARGEVVLGDTQKPIRVDMSPSAGEVTINPEGQVMQAGSAVGKLRVVTFEGAKDLTHEGGNLLAAAPNAARPGVNTKPLDVGALEESNATVVSAMTEMVTASRTFEAFERAIDAFREADRKIISTVPGT